MRIRPGEPADLPAIAAIQDASPEAARWEVADYLAYDLRVAVMDERIAGFLASRTVALLEVELLNLAVGADFRRKGIARALVSDLLSRNSGDIFLEVRASNQAALNLYKSMGFQEVGSRPAYYQNPLEAAIVMKFHSC